jgi:hypothetical protein
VRVFLDHVAFGNLPAHIVGKTAPFCDTLPQAECRRQKQADHDQGGLKKSPISRLPFGSQGGKLIDN